MSQNPRSSIHNHLLSALPSEAFALLELYLRPARLEFRQILSEPNEPIA
jgi:hypothetical protein